MGDIPTASVPAVAAQGHPTYRDLTRLPRVSYRNLRDLRDLYGVRPLESATSGEQITRLLLVSYSSPRRRPRRRPHRPCSPTRPITRPMCRTAAKPAGARVAGPWCARAGASAAKASVAQDSERGACDTNTRSPHSPPHMRPAPARPPSPTRPSACRDGCTVWCRGARRGRGRQVRGGARVGEGGRAWRAAP